ncbi:hypothetical protein H0Z60_04145 [Ectothiorhodospiraceae bacterium WFHF3C12]|nr:hypothetical protein [Ectothiorhodospiraceae bacterium WFHF3C12]
MALPSQRGPAGPGPARPQLPQIHRWGPVLTNFLHYALKAFRLDFSRTYIDPFWQLLYENVQVMGECDAFVVRRVYKTPARGDERNLALAFGNMLSVYARYEYKTKDVIAHLKGAGLWNGLCEYWRRRKKDPQEVIARALSLRRLAA